MCSVLCANHYALLVTCKHCDKKLSTFDDPFVVLLLGVNMYVALILICEEFGDVAFDC